MNAPVFCTAGHTSALDYAIAALKRRDCDFAETPDKTVTHLLLPVPSFNPDGTLKGGKLIAPVLEKLSRNVTVVGGMLDHNSLPGYKTTDLLQDPLYLAENADITAHCAVKLAMTKLPVTLRGCHILVIGWGRIGKCLAALLKNMGAYVTVATRKEADRAILTALGYDTLDTRQLDYSLLRFQVIFNTAPIMVLPEQTAQYCHSGCLKIDLASAPGIAGSDVVWARGLPNSDAPQSSGELIAKTTLRLIRN